MMNMIVIELGGDKGTRTLDLVSAIDALSQTELYPPTPVGLARLELAASRLSGARSNQLSYSPKSTPIPTYHD